jgi:hypothetical protein
MTEVAWYNSQGRLHAPLELVICNSIVMTCQLQHRYCDQCITVVVVFKNLKTA